MLAFHLTRLSSCGCSHARSPSACAVCDGKGPHRSTRVFDKGVFEVELHHVPAQRAQRFDDLPLRVAEIDDHQLEPAVDFPRVDQPFAAGEFGRPPGKFEQDLPHALLEALRGAVDAQLAVDKDADAIGHALDVGKDVRAVEDRPSLALDQLDQRDEELAPRDRVETQRRIVQDEQVGIGGDRQAERRLAPAGPAKAAGSSDAAAARKCSST